MGVPAPKEVNMSQTEDRPSISDRCFYKAFEIEIDRQSPVITVHAYSMSHALTLAARIQIYCDETVTVRLAK